MIWNRGVKPSENPFQNMVNAVSDDSERISLEVDGNKAKQRADMILRF